MANEKKLGSIVQIDGESYEVLAKSAEVASKLTNSLTLSIKKGTADANTTEFDGSAAKVATIEIPTYKLTKSGSTITLTGSDGTKTDITDSNTGDMVKSTYDKNGNGIVDDAEKLGGIAAENYATKTYVATEISTAIDTVDNKKQDKLISGNNIKTINDISLLGSGNITITSGGGGTSDVASKIKVTMNDNITQDATITIKSEDPSGGNVGDIWFKYLGV